MRVFGKKFTRQSWKIFLLALWPLALFLGSLFYFTHISEFSAAYISSPFKGPKEFLNLGVEQKNLVDRIFSQNFKFKGSDDQNFIFESEDGQFSLKFFKMHQLIGGKWLKYIPIPALSKVFFLNHYNTSTEKVRQIFKNYKDVYGNLKENTNLVFLHLNKSKDLKKKVRLFDDHNKEYVLPLDNFEFIVEERLISAESLFHDLMSKGSVDQAKKAFVSILDLINIRNQKGYGDRSLEIIENFGFRDGRAVYTNADVLTREDKSFLVQEPSVSHDLRVVYWVQEKYPDIISTN